jgi:hypothetical protein
MATALAMGRQKQRSASTHHSVATAQSAALVSFHQGCNWFAFHTLTWPATLAVCSWISWPVCAAHGCRVVSFHCCVACGGAGGTVESGEDGMVVVVRWRVG